MTANFSFKRIIQLVGKQWIENRRLYLMSVFALLGLLGIVFVFWAATTGSHYSEEALYIIGLFGLFITGSIFASTAFNMLGSKDKGIYWISFPASHFEKFLATWFFNFVIFSVAYLMCFLLLKTAAESYVQTLIKENPLRYEYRRLDWNNENGLGAVLPNFISAFFVVQAAFLLGSVAFKRFSFIITIVLIAVFLFLFIYFVSKVAIYGLPGYNWNLFSLREGYVQGEDTYKEYLTAPFIKEGILFFLRFLIAPVLWFITWVKLKEKQI
jgi:hypothetical protein